MTRPTDEQVEEIVRTALDLQPAVQMDDQQVEYLSRWVARAVLALTPGSREAEYREALEQIAAEAESTTDAITIARAALRRGE